MPSTRAEFKRQITLRERDELVAKGSQMMATILSPRGFLVVTDIGDSINSMLYKLGCSQASDLYFKVGGGFITSEQISAELDMAGITKESLHITTISLRGLDQPGILRDIAGLISQTGRNIEMVNMHNQNGLMDLRLLVKDLSGDQEANLRRTLEGDPRFTECLVV